MEGNGTETIILYVFNWQTLFLKAQVTVFRSDTVDGEYTEFMKFPKVGACAFMKTIYKKYFYSSMKDCSNLPSPDTCPLTKVIKMVFRANLNKEKLQLFSFIFFVRL